MRIRQGRAWTAMRWPASIRKAARITIGNEPLGVVDDLSGRNISDGLWRRVIALSCDRFWSHLRVRGRHGDDRSVLEARAGIRSRSDLLIVELRRQRQVLLHCRRRILVLQHRSRRLGDRLGLILAGAVIYRLGTLLRRVKAVAAVADRGPGRGAKSCHGFCDRFPHFGDGVRIAEGKLGVGQPGKNSDEQAELDRDQVHNFQVHFRQAPL